MLQFPQEDYNTTLRAARIPLGFDVGFYVIVVLAAGFSGYTTYLGFQYDLPEGMALVIAAIIGLGLLLTVTENVPKIPSSSII
tara:strand:- start:35 stop:283 length:249 start_codon:yes stop_codon:yes gene_type:complete